MSGADSLRQGAPEGLKLAWANRNSRAATDAHVGRVMEPSRSGAPVRARLLS